MLKKLSHAEEESSNCECEWGVLCLG